MSAARISAPGTEYGPCAEPCQHMDCASARGIAESACVICGVAIGYERRFYREDGGGFVHAVCAEDEADGKLVRP